MQHVFIGTSVASLETAKRLSALLGPTLHGEVWDAGAFSDDQLSRTALEALTNKTRTADFAIFLLTADDYRKKNTSGADQYVPRDNVVFEAGLFIGALGRDRVVLCMDSRVIPPTDLAGVNMIAFEDVPDKASLNFQNVLQGIAEQIKRKFASASEGHLDKLSFGDARHTNIIVDSAFQPIDRREMRKEVATAIDAGKRIPTRLFYATEEGASLWLRLTEDPGYKFYAGSLRLFRRVAPEIVRALRKLIVGPPPDVISLGSGDGEKDVTLVAAIAQELAQEGRSDLVTYYPLDYSFYLIVEAVAAAARNLEPNAYRIKPIIGDMTDLASFRYVYDSFPNPNLFVVLGNTLGNNDEAEIMDALRNAIQPGDAILLEVNTDQQADEKNVASDDYLFSQQSLKHDFTPLALLGEKFDPAKFSILNLQGRSQCPDAVSFETVFNRTKRKAIRLSMNHRYKFDSFCSWVVRELSVRRIWSKEENGVGLVLLYRERA